MLGDDAPSQVPYDTLFRESPNACLVLSPELRIVDATDAYLAATMTRRSDIVGRHLFDVFPDNPEDPQASGEHNVRASLDRVLATRLPDTMAVQKYDVRRPEAEGGDFEERHWSPLNIPVLDQDGAVRFILHRVEDVTDFVRLEQARDVERRETDTLRSHAQHIEAEIVARSTELQQKNDELRVALTQLGVANDELARQTARLQRADELKSQFLAMASHELRTPLTAILGFTSTMLRRWTQIEDDEKLQFLEIIDSQGSRLGRLVEDLLTLSQVESGKLRVDPQVVDISLALRKALRDLGEEDVEVRAPAGLDIVADAGHLNQIVVNLVSNAAKYGKPPVELDVTYDAGCLQLSVADRGPGVPRAFVPHLFETFARARTDLAGAQGTGLGLSITRALVTAHGGDVWYEPNQPCGARFTARIPAKLVMH